MARRPRNLTWSRPEQAAPFQPHEDAELCQMVGCGLSIEFYRENLPGRAFGEILDRRLTLIKSGAVTPKRPL